LPKNGTIDKNWDDNDNLFILGRDGSEKCVLGSGLGFKLRSRAFAGLGAYVVKLCSGSGSGLRA
jgi:hypothetical protein